jgi:phospholipid/cholesterol/gamma-HCH transport system substrate-binding protein
MNRFSLEVKVGIVVSITVALILGFVFFLGQYNPFAKSFRVNALYNFAGGIELGSAVRVAGVKVGKVDQIKFFEPGHKFNGEPATISIRLQIDKRAQHLIRKDSMFYISMAGIIGEKYIEINPGSMSSPQLENNASVRGIDPPRLDEMLSQGYAMFDRLSKKLDSMSEEDKEKMRSLFENLVTLSQSLSDLGQKSSQFTGMINDTHNMINDTHKLVRNLDAIVSPIAPRTADDRANFEARIREINKTIDNLSSLSQRLDRMSARIDKDLLSGVTKQSLERTVRQIVQQEGVTINLGKKVGKLEYPALPAPPDQPPMTQEGK